MTVRADQKEERRQAIIEAGLELFVRRGYAGTKIADIAERVGMSVGLLFHYFDSKESLYEALVTIGVEGTKDAFSIPHEDPISFFYEVARVTLACLREGELSARIFVLMAQASMNESAPQSVKDLVRQCTLIQDSIPIIKKGQRSGAIRKGNAHALSMAYWSSLQGIAESVAYEPDTPLPDPDWIVDIIRDR